VVDPMKLSVKTVLNGKERQNYPVADMFFPPHKLVRTTCPCATGRRR